jgi:hypothetical protein
MGVDKRQSKLLNKHFGFYHLSRNEYTKQVRQEGYITPSLCHTSIVVNVLAIFSSMNE